MTPETPESPRQIVDARKAPPGVMPRHIQTWVLVGITALMIAVLIFTGPAPAPTPRTAVNPALATVDPSTSKIQEYQRQIDEQTKRLAAERAELELTKRVMTSASNTGQRAPQTETQPPADRPAPDAMQQERAQREVRSRYADPIVLTTRTAPSTTSNSAGPHDLMSGQSRGGMATPHDHLSQAGASRDDRTTQTAADSTFRLPEGTVIESVLVNELKGVFTGPVNTMVSTPVYSTDGQHVLIPAGSRLLGEAHPVATTGQTRLAVTFHRLEVPERAPVNLDQFVGLNQEGDAGLADQVNHHYFQVFGASIALGALGGLAQANTAYGLDRSGSDAYRQGVASSFGQSSAHILDQYLNRPADVTIRVGHRVRVYLSKDLELPAYVPTPSASAGIRGAS